MSHNNALLQRLGFSPDRLRFATITACASIIALFIAQYFQLVHPQWAAMTVWASAQPWRENLLEKSWWRFAGTVSGVLAGVLLIYLHMLHPLLFILGLAVWLGACSGIGQLQKGFVAYGTLLAGYSAVMVSMLSVHDTNNIFMVAWDRFWTILVGVLSAVIFNYLFTPKRDQAPATVLKNQIDQRFYAVLHHALNKKESVKQEDIDTLWQQIASYDELLEANRIGWRYHRKQVVQARQRLIAQSQILLHLAQFRSIAAFPFPEHEPSEKEWKHLLFLCPNGPLKSLLITLYYAIKGTSIKRVSRIDKLKLHQDKISAWHAFTRSFITIGVVGVLWSLTQWQTLAYLTLGLSVMLTIFASFDYPDRFMKNVFIGQFLGAVAALLCTWFLWPFANSSWQMALFIIPVIVSGILVFAHSRLIFIAFDYIMVSLILLQPSYPFSLSLPTSIGNAIAIVCGPLVAMAAFMWIYPTNPQKRYQHLLRLAHRQFKQGILQLAQGNKPSTTRIMHRLLNGLALAKKSEFPFKSTLEFFEIRHGIWLVLLMLYKQFSHNPSKKRALNVLVFRLQHDKITPYNIERIMQRLQRNENSNRVVLLHRYLNKLSAEKIS
ncbi:FUSC family protein [Providencia sp. 21OH12SH02B-Prov]|uniref:FUSC family protein n=1 Tax=unclassified Providencia TaxID=2633465 RepID=UPI0022B7155D|nr:MULTISPECIES: FUSC family protein [unclassified Providencia]ELR5122782.1 FUSC family protein [Providencia stuartii]WBA57090.1 FUSC family protein [Providencia sp. 21OH12SH02B-Prov]